MQLQITRWHIDHDTPATQSCYGKMSAGVKCDCHQCRNFNAAVDRCFPQDFENLLDQLGIDRSKPIELCHWYREPSGLYVTGGWYHLVGTIVSGDDTISWENNTGHYHYEKLESGIEFGFTRELALVNDAFAEMSVIQLEFQTLVPWLLNEPEPTE
jgi:hypothetical protein